MPFNNPSIRRYTDIDFPVFKYIPKLSIHPSKLNGATHIPQFKDDYNKFTDKTWQNSKIYLYAIDLFNYGYYWEVHEVLERLWIGTGKKSSEGIYIQGIIQLSVAMLKSMQNNKTGYCRLKEKASYKLLTQPDIYLGINTQSLLNQCNSHVFGVDTNFPIIQLNF